MRLTRSPSSDQAISHELRRRKPFRAEEEGAKGKHVLVFRLERRTADDPRLLLQQSIPIAPQPRRSSSDGRPKREIHPPPSKTLPYFEDQLEVSHSKTKKKSTSAKSSKLAAEELKFAEKVMKEVHKTKHYAFTTPFLQPVGECSFNLARSASTAAYCRSLSSLPNCQMPSHSVSPTIPKSSKSPWT